MYSRDEIKAITDKILNMAGSDGGLLVTFFWYIRSVAGAHTHG